MCDTCGCGQPGTPAKITRPGEEHSHDHSHGHGHSYDHDHSHDHDHGTQRLISVQEDLLGKNRLLASRNSGYFEARGILALNIMSSPGSGKTTLLEQTIRLLKDRKAVAVIEGDQQTLNDAKRIEAAGAPAVQVNTGNACHLDAEMIMNAVKKLDPVQGSLLFIENVGNLICPSLFDLGENYRVVMFSTTEGEDKPLKYPTMFAGARLCIISKMDLLPHLEFDLEKAKAFASRVNPELQFIELSSLSGEGMEDWITWILDKCGQTD